MEARGGFLLEEKEEIYRDREASSDSPGHEARTGRPDPEVTEIPTRRKFTAEYKLRILQEADACTTLGEVGVLIRREGLYSSHLTRWRKKRREGTLGALSPDRRGPKPKPVNPLEARVTELEQENRRLAKKLEVAQTIIEIQKKVSGLLGIDLGSPEPGEER